MEPTVEKILQGIPFAGMGTTLERNGLIDVIKKLIKQNKYTVDYILNYCESVGYQHKMAEEVFTELTGLSPKLIINNNEYYKMPSYVPNMCIAWGLAKTKANTAFYIVPFDYGYCVMEKNETDSAIPVIEVATIPEAIDELKKVAKKIQTLHKIVNEKLLETQEIQTEADSVHSVNLPYASDPIFLLKKNLKNKVIDAKEFEIRANKLVAENKLTVDEAEQLLDWEKDLLDEDEDSESYANDVLQNNEKWNDLEAATDIDFNDLYELRYVGNISLYKKKLKQLSDEQLQEYKQWAKDFGINEQDLNLEILEKKSIYNKKQSSKKMKKSSLGWGAKPENIEDDKTTYVDSDLVQYHIEKFPSGKWYYWFNNPISKKREQVGPYSTEQEAREFLKKHHSDIDSNHINEKAFKDFFNLKPKKFSSSKKIAAEDTDLDDLMSEKSKEEVQEEMEQIKDTPVSELLMESTPSEYFDKALDEDKVDTINDIVSKCVDKFSEKFKDFSRYNVKILSYNTKILGEYTPNTNEMIEDVEINANAILQIILSISNAADNTEVKKALAVFTITNGKLHWSGTIRGENDEIIAFTEEALDSLFEISDESNEDNLEDII